MRTLVLGPMPEGAAPETHVASGPWCFAGREDAFPGWDTGLFPMPPDPFTGAGSMEVMAGSANAEALRLTGLLAQELGRSYGVNRSSGFWEMALLPFVILFTHMICEREARARELVRLYGQERLRVDVLPAGAYFSFQSTRDFMVRGVQDQGFNHYIFSRIVEYLEPPGWELHSLPPAVLNISQDDEEGVLTERWKIFLRRQARRLPFPWQKSFGPWRCLALSLAVLLNRNTLADRSRGFSTYCREPINWPPEIMKLLKACVPMELRLGLRERGRSSSTSPARWPKGSGPLRGMLPLYSQDDAYRLELAEEVHAGARHFCIQHGANYGQLACPGMIPFEYSRHAFFSWGWEEHAGVPGNITPMLHPALTALCAKHRETREELILVGTEMSTYTYRLKSRPLAAGMLSYRRDKARFIRAFTAAMAEKDGNLTLEQALERVAYRPYFAVAGGLDDGAFVRREVPGVALCQGDLTARMLNCRLLALDHYGTTLHMALAADVPVVAFWDRRAWGMESGTEPYLERLAEAGILHPGPVEAGLFAARHWEDVRSWWHGAAARDARQAWLWRYARCSHEDGRVYRRGELTGEWFKALRNC